MNENEIIKLAKKGDKHALELLYNANFNSLFKFVRFKVDSEAVAEDIVAEAFIRSFENIRKFKEKSSFKTYVYTIARNLVIDWYKSKGSDISITNVEYGIKGEEEISQRDIEVKLNNDMDEIKRIFSYLNDKEQDVLELRYLSNFSVKETAQALSISESNVKVITHRALSKARDVLN